MLSSLARGYGSWMGDVDLDQRKQPTNDSFPVVGYPDPHRHGVTVTPRSRQGLTATPCSRAQSASPSMRSERSDGQLALPKTFITRKGALLLFSAPDNLEKLDSSYQQCHTRRKSKKLIDLSLKLGTLERLSASILQYGDQQDYDREVSSVSDAKNKLFLKFLRQTTDLDGQCADAHVKPGEDLGFYLRDLKSRASSRLYGASDPAFGPRSQELREILRELEGVWPGGKPLGVREAFVHPSSVDNNDGLVSSSAKPRVLSSKRLAASLKSSTYLGRPTSAEVSDSSSESAQVNLPSISSSYSHHVKSPKVSAQTKSDHDDGADVAWKIHSKTASHGTSSEKSSERIVTSPCEDAEEEIFAAEDDGIYQEEEDLQQKQDGESLTSSVVDEQEIVLPSDGEEDEGFSPRSDQWPQEVLESKDNLNLADVSENEGIEHPEFENQGDADEEEGDISVLPGATQPLMPQYTMTGPSLEEGKLVEEDDKRNSPLVEETTSPEEEDKITPVHLSPSASELALGEKSVQEPKTLISLNKDDDETGDVTGETETAAVPDGVGSKEQISESESPEVDAVKLKVTFAEVQEESPYQKPKSAPPAKTQNRSGPAAKVVQEPAPQVRFPSKSATPPRVPPKSPTPAKVPPKSATPAKVPSKSATPAKVPPKSVTPAKVSASSRVLFSRTSQKPRITPWKRQDKTPMGKPAAGGKNFVQVLDITSVQPDVDDDDDEDSDGHMTPPEKQERVPLKPMPHRSASADKTKAAVLPSHMEEVMQRRSASKSHEELENEMLQMKVAVEDALSGPTLFVDNEEGLTAEELKLAEEALQERVKDAESKIEEVTMNKAPPQDKRIVQAQAKMPAGRKGKRKGQAPPEKRNLVEEREAIREQRKLEKKARLEEARQLQEKIAAKEKLRKAQEEEAEQKAQELKEQMEELQREAEEIRQAEEDAHHQLIAARKADREEREKRRREDLERKKREATARREKEREMMERARRKEEEMLKRIADAEMKRQLQEEEQAKREEEERLAQERFEEEMRQAQLAAEEEERRMRELEQEAEEEAMQRLIEEREEAENKKWELEQLSWKLKELEEAKRQKMLEDEMKLENERRLKEEEEERKKEEERRRLQELQRMEEEAREKMRFELEHRRELAMKRREKNLERRANLDKVRHGQGITKPWVFSYFIMWPKDVYCRPMGEDPKKKKGFRPRQKPKPAPAAPPPPPPSPLPPEDKGEAVQLPDS